MALGSVRKHREDLVVLLGPDVAGVAQVALPLAGPAGEQVPLEGLLVLELAGAGRLEPLLGTGVRLSS
jgi:hypothetical protein